MHKNYLLLRSTPKCIVSNIISGQVNKIELDSTPVQRFRPVSDTHSFPKYLLRDDTFLQCNRHAPVSKCRLDVTLTQDKVILQHGNNALSALIKRHHSIAYKNILKEDVTPEKRHCTKSTSN